PYLPQPRPESRSARQVAREIFRTLWNRSLFALLLGGLLGGVGGGLRNGLSIYFYTHFWGLDPNQYGWLLPLGALGSILAVFLAPPLSRRFGKKQTAIVLFLFSVVAFSAPFVLRLLGWMPANGSPWLMPILVVDAIVTAVVAVVGFVLFGSMTADVVEDAAVKTGVRSEGLLFAANGLLLKFTGGIGAFVAGALLHIVHFPAHAIKGSVDPAIMHRLVILYLPINAAFSFASILVLALYRIDRRTHEKNLETLAEAAAILELEHANPVAETGPAAAPVVRGLPG
ncbi:MAG: MFS transporter, partial [Candidatus Dormibacteria bacterium]